MTRKTALILLLVPGLAMAGTVSFSSANGQNVLRADAPASAGLEAIYIADGTAGVTISYTAASADAQVKWQRYSSLGGGYAEDVAGVTADGAVTRLENPQGDMGYIIEEGTDRTYLWLVDYSRHRLDLGALTMGRSDDCSLTSLDLEGSAGPITYYSINGRAMTLSRELKMSYLTLEWDAASESYVQRTAEEELDDAGSTIRVTAPLCATAFTLTGDRFLTQWGRAQSVSSPVYEAVAVEAHTTATQTAEKPENQVSTGDALGGSAPAEIEFNAAVTDAAIFTEWQFSSYSDFEDIELRINEPVCTHVFDELGTTYVRFVCDNADGTCGYTGEVYQINIGESSLLCPNAFSPGASEGVNDEWRVSYKSIVCFECHIFDRQGNKMATLTDPSQGWDGKKGGKLVPAGVYYYVIKARGADGRKYNLSGDINIINYK